MGDIKERIMQFIEYKGCSKNKFETMCGLPVRYVSNIGKAIQSDIIEKIILTYPELSIDWLVMGRGEMIVRKEYPTTEDTSVPEMREELAIYRKTLNNLNDIVERQNRRLDEMEVQFKNKQLATVDSDVAK